ncbi:unnamed protein product [Effrenium voratum]|uniref:Uncharacterized protein n=1 Tax=Effrenium voratum TaxID=2562239 RepID=A0AA36MS97_9DINO|nr:unnamed protein product [Effrenium voratum]
MANPAEAMAASHGFEGSGQIPSLPVTPGGFPALLDAARQQTELVFWMVRTVQEHESKITSLSRQLSDQLCVQKLLSEERKSFRARRMPSSMGNRGLSRESFNSADFNMSQAPSSPRAAADLHDSIEEKPLQEDKTHIEQVNVDLTADAQEADIQNLLEASDSQADLPDSSATDSATDSKEAPGRTQSMSSEVRRFSFLEGGRRPSTRSLPLPVDPSMAGNNITEERLVERMEERLQQVLAEDVEHRLEDLAQYIQEEMYRFVLGPDLMERVRQEASSVCSIEMAVALAAQDKKMEELVLMRVEAALGDWQPPSPAPPPAPPTPPPNTELLEAAEALSKRVNTLEDMVSELKGVRLQVPDMRNDISTLQSSIAACVQTIEELEVQQQELAAAGAKRASPARQMMTPSGSAADADGLEDEVPAVASPSPAPSPSPSPAPPMPAPASPDVMKPKRRLSDMLGLYMPPPPKQPAVDDAQVQDGALRVGRSPNPQSEELISRTETMKTRVEQLEQLVGTETASRRNSLQNKINDIDTLAQILEDRMRELDTDYRSSNQKVQSQLDILMAAHETQQAEDLKHNKTWNLANQVDVILSIVNAEMRSVRTEFDQKLSTAILSGKSHGDHEEKMRAMGDKEMQDLEEKVKRLQDSQQQSMLKIAGLRSAHKHAEAQANFALEKLKRLQSEVGNLVDQVVGQQARLDYLLVHGAATQHEGGSFKAIVSVGKDDGKKPKLKAGVTMPPRQMAEKTPTHADRSSPDFGKMPTESSGQEEVNASRMARLGKKMLELDGEVNRSISELRGDLQGVNKTLLAFLELLPRRLRRMLQRQLFPEPSEDDTEDIKVDYKSDDGKKVMFDANVETRTFTVEEDTGRLPWQLAGEPDIKWSWCFKPRDEMGRDLAMCFEQFETEREEFEAKILQWLQSGGAPPNLTRASVRGSVWAGHSGGGGMVTDLAMAEDSAVALPQMMHMEERLERLGTEFFNLKRVQDVDHVRKVDKEELQQLATRLGSIEKLNVPDLKIRIESLEGDTKFTAQSLSDVAEKLFKVESVAVPRAELVKVQNGFEDMRSDHQAMKVELKEISASSYNSNRKFVHELTEVKSWAEHTVAGLEKKKVDIPDLAQLVEKVSKLEYSIKDNRRILGDGGQEINAVVRRIILNLEDKIMVLEKKIDAIADARPKAQDSMRIREESPSKQSFSYQSTDMQEAAVQSIGEELSAMTEAVTKLKQDLSVSKVHIDEMAEQGQQNLELASRLHVFVQSSGMEGMDDEGTALSLNRVQVMVAAAARQLVAGSKWITKETFDSRFDQIRGEYLKELRQVQAKLEDLSSKTAAPNLASVQVTMPTMPAKLPKMILQHVAQDRLGTAPATTRPIAAPMTARTSRPATVEARPRARHGRTE